MVVLLQQHKLRHPIGGHVGDLQKWKTMSPFFWGGRGAGGHHSFAIIVLHIHPMSARWWCPLTEEHKTSKQPVRMKDRLHLPPVRNPSTQVPVMTDEQRGQGPWTSGAFPQSSHAQSSAIPGWVVSLVSLIYFWFEKFSFFPMEYVCYVNM